LPDAQICSPILSRRLRLRNVRSGTLIGLGKIGRHLGDRAAICSLGHDEESIRGFPTSGWWIDVAAHLVTGTNPRPLSTGAGDTKAPDNLENDEHR